MLIKASKKNLKILDFDMETRKVGFHSAGQFKPEGCEPVIIAASWFGEDKVKTWSLSPTWDEKDIHKMLNGFVSLYEQADMITGHYISKYDLPIINGALLEFGYKPLSDKLMTDTKTGMKTIAGLSASQENLGALKTLDDAKFHMNDNMWRAVGRLTPNGLALARERVVADVIQHKNMYNVLLPWLNRPVRWKS
jgi:DNA polymerase elongation subunit (family B)